MKQVGIGLKFNHRKTEDYMLMTECYLSVIVEEAKKTMAVNKKIKAKENKKSKLEKSNKRLKPL